MNEQEKKRTYNGRIFEIDHGTLTSLVFSINVVWEESAKMFTPVWHN